MNVTDTKTLGANDDYTQGRIEHDDEEVTAVVEDFAWGLKCILDGAQTKPIAGCLFARTRDGKIAVTIPHGGFELTETEAAEFVREWRGEYRVQ